MNREISLRNTKIKDDFWSPRQELVREIVIPYQEKILDDKIPGAEKSHAFANFRIAAGLEEGEFYGMVFQDSDVAKWLEGVAYSLSVCWDEALEKRADEIIDIIAKAQQEDGYLNTYFTIKEPEHRWQNLQECHELYCAGHMMEAAAAYYEVTGKDKLLWVMEKMADHIDARFGEGKENGIPGHQEIELGLLRMYQATGTERYLKLAKYFINERGKDPEFFKKEKEKRQWTHFGIDPEDTKYNQSYAPVREQKTAEGHSVRAVYMYTAMAELAGKTGDVSLLNACETLWENITKKRMYITGGIGSTGEGEAFTVDYDLPGDMAYAETCASIGLVFFAKKMLDIKPDRKYADIMERALYNGILSGMQLDGTKFFYVNPLEVNPEISGKIHGYKHVLSQRPGWYACACCPPNVVRMLMSLGKYAWSESEDTIYSHLYLGGEFEVLQTKIEVESAYPWKGDICYTIHTDEPKQFKLAIRIPEYVKQKTVLLNGEEIETGSMERNGYIYLDRIWKDDDQVKLAFDLEPRRVYSHSAVRNNTGCVAIMRGPLVYCLEGLDHKSLLQEIRLPKKAVFEKRICNEGILEGMVLLRTTGERFYSETDELYTEQPMSREETEITAIPYFAWGNRGLNQMRVWIAED